MLIPPVVCYPLAAAGNNSLLEPHPGTDSSNGPVSQHPLGEDAAGGTRRRRQHHHQQQRQHQQQDAEVAELTKLLLRQQNQLSDLQQQVAALQAAVCRLDSSAPGCPAHSGP